MQTEVARNTAAVLDALRNRRSIGKVKPDRPPKELIEQLLEYAVWAPNHYRTNPWRFKVLAGTAREELGRIMADNRRATMANPDHERAKVALEREAYKPLRAPVLITVAVSPSDDPKIIEIEEVCAGAAAVQNILLAAHALGLAAYWRTGDAAYDDRVKAWLGLEPTDHIVGFVYVGYSDMTPPEQSRPPAGELTEWRGWE